MEHLIAGLSGALFGFALDKGKPNVPYVVSEQMEMRNMLMLRMFLSATATSTAAAAVLHLGGWRERDVRTSISLGLGKLGGYGGNLVGGLLLGAGMYLSGSCPGTIWSQLALEGTHRTSLVLGSIAGMFLYGYAFEPMMKKNFPKYQSRGEKDHADLLRGKVKYELASVALVGVVGLVLAGVDKVFPWQGETAKVIQGYKHSGNPFPSLHDVAWDPAVSGIIVGLLQIPVHFTSMGLLGMSSAWSTLAGYVAWLVDPNVAKNAPYLDKSRSNAVGLLQAFVGVGVIAGTFLSQHMSGYPQLTAAAVAGSNIGGNGPLGQSIAFVGAVFLMLGARIQAGCTSGHGLSGLSSLSLASLVSVAGMFGGGMAMGFTNTLILGN